MNWIRTLSGRIESESEPPNLATEKYGGCGGARARSPQSPVRMRRGGTAKARGIAGVSRAKPRCAPEVSAAAD
jgi:hypothetical protein